MNDNKIKKYNDMIYSSRPVKFTEYITNQYDKIHDELYTDALNKFLDDVSNNIDKFEQFKNYSDKTDIIENTKIFEIKMKEYWMPSSILVMCKKYPYRRKKYSLEDYWNNYQDKSKIKINNIKLLDEEINDAEILYLDYVNGKAKVESRLNDIQFEIDFDYINEDTKISDEYSLENNFTNKYYN